MKGFARTLAVSQSETTVRSVATTAFECRRRSSTLRKMVATVAGDATRVVRSGARQSSTRKRRPARYVSSVSSSSRATLPRFLSAARAWAGLQPGLGMSAS